jgi:hypothetical protein
MASPVRPRPAWQCTATFLHSTAVVYCMICRDSTDTGHQQLSTATVCGSSSALLLVLRITLSTVCSTGLRLPAILHTCANRAVLYLGFCASAFAVLCSAALC